MLDANHVGLVPIELCNGCNEDNCTIDSDSHILTNIIRKHYLEHFGHRDMVGLVNDYSPDAIMVTVINGVRKSYHGHDEIRTAFEDVFKLHPTVNSTFTLKHIEIHSTPNKKDVRKASKCDTKSSGITIGGDRNGHGHGTTTGMAIWSATTPTNIFPQSSDTYLFDSDTNKILKQYFTCTIDHLNTPWYVDDN